MKAEIVMIGTELLLGQIVDTNAAFIGQVLAENGIHLYQKTTVGDNQDRIVRVLDAALDRADVLLLSGGLGPTEDDLTRESIAAVLGRPLEFRQDLMEQVKARFAQIRRPMTENNRKQAFAPLGAVAIENPNGTAPGLIVEDARGTIIAMPGVPSELKAMLIDSVIPYLRKKFDIAGLLYSRVLKVAGIGESRVDALIGDLIRTQENPTVGVLASPDVVRIRITAHAPDVAQAEAMIAEVEAKVRQRLPGSIFGADDDTLESAIDAELVRRGWSLAIAEAATGGAIAQRLTEAGVRSFAGGLVLDPERDEDALHGAEALAEYARTEFGTDCALAVTWSRDGEALEGCFLTQDKSTLWALPGGNFGRLTRLRIAVTALEYMRRKLLDLPIHPDGLQP